MRLINGNLFAALAVIFYRDGDVEDIVFTTRCYLICIHVCPLNGLLHGTEATLPVDEVRVSQDCNLFGCVVSPS